MSRKSPFRSWTILGLAFALVAAGPLGLLFAISSPTLRGAPLVAIFGGIAAAGGVLAFAHAGAKRSILSFLLAGIAASVAALFIVGAVVATRVPESPGVPRAGDPVPAFAIDGAPGRSLSSADLAARGPRVLVFFRGTW